MKKSPQITVENLRKAGFKVFVTHTRKVEPDRKELIRALECLKPTMSHIKKGGFTNLSKIVLQPISQKVCARGGFTSVEIVKGEKTYKATALVNPEDYFCKRRGVSIALGRIVVAAANNGDVLI